MSETFYKIVRRKPGLVGPHRYKRSRFSAMVRGQYEFEYRIGEWQTCPRGLFFVFKTLENVQNFWYGQNWLIKPHYELWEVGGSGGIEIKRILLLSFMNPKQDTFGTFWRLVLSGGDYVIPVKTSNAPEGTWGVKEIKLKRLIIGDEEQWK